MVPPHKCTMHVITGARVRARARVADIDACGEAGSGAIVR
jgi:hypothetical protein